MEQLINHFVNVLGMAPDAAAQLAVKLFGPALAQPGQAGQAGQTQQQHDEADNQELAQQQQHYYPVGSSWPTVGMGNEGVTPMGAYLSSVASRFEPPPQSVARDISYQPKRDERRLDLSVDGRAGMNPELKASNAAEQRDLDLMRWAHESIYRKSPKGK